MAVAPVTHWKYYDNIYTERYNGLPKDNQKGYDAGSPLSYVDGLRGNLLVIHGSGDDNVHYQNTEALVNKLVAANKPFSMMEYPEPQPRHLRREHAAAPVRPDDALPAGEPARTGAEELHLLTGGVACNTRRSSRSCRYAGDHGQAVRVTTDGAAEVIGVPTSVDDHVTAHEVYLRPAGADDTEISISLGAIRFGAAVVAWPGLAGSASRGYVAD